MKKMVLCMLVLCFSLGGCSSSDEKESINTSEKTSSSTKQKEKKIISSKTKEYESYQSILDDYTKKLQEASPKLVEEYNKEYPTLNGDINALAELSNKKVEKLAEISNDGTGEMAKLQLAGESDYSKYEEWAGKLIDVYTQEAQRIMDAYLASAGTSSVPNIEVPNVQGQTNESYVEEPTSESSSPQVQQLEPSSETVASEAPAQYGTVQPGEGPQQIAGRYGISVDELLSLNGMDRSNFYFDPGSQIRIK